MSVNFEILTAIEKLTLLSDNCSDAAGVAIERMISALKQVDNYYSKSIVDFTSEDFGFDIRDRIADIKDEFPELLGEIQASKSLAIDLVAQKHSQLLSLKGSLESVMKRLDEFDQDGFGGQHQRRRGRYEEIMNKIDQLLVLSSNT